MLYVASNTGTTTLAAAITSSSQTSITLATGTGAKFPSPTGGNYTLVTLELGTTKEIVSIVGRSGDTLTVGIAGSASANAAGRGMEGTIATTWSIGDLIECRNTAAIIAKGANSEAAANKDATGGYAGLTLFKLNLRNAANTITSWFTTAATVARTWTMPDKDGTVAMTSDITGTNSGVNTGDQTNISGNAATVTTNANLTGVVTSTGNATAIADAALSIAKTSGLQTSLNAKALLAGSSGQAFNTAALTTSGIFTAALGIKITGGVSAQGTIFSEGVNGLLIRGITGSNNDFNLISVTNNSLLRNPTGTNNLVMTGFLNIPAFSTDNTFNLNVGSVNIVANTVVGYPAIGYNIASGNASDTWRFGGTDSASWIQFQGNTGRLFVSSNSPTAGALITKVEALSWNSTQVTVPTKLLATGTGGIGYGVGAGGTVTQATSKSTAVTLNKVSGQITTHDQSMLNGAYIFFVVNCNVVELSDSVTLTPYWGAVYPGDYEYVISFVSNNNFGIRIKNISGVTRAEALQINFLITKGSTS